MKPATFEAGIWHVIRKHDLEDNFSNNVYLLANSQSWRGVKRAVGKLRVALHNLKDAYFNYELPFGMEWPCVETQWVDIILNTTPILFFLNNSPLLESDEAKLKIRNLFLKQEKLMSSKQHDYGHQNIMEFGQKGLVVRCFDKLNRIENLIKRFGESPVAMNESFLDSWMDIWNYALIGLMVREGVFTLPLALDLKGK